MEEKLYNIVLDDIKAKGYDISRLERTPQNI